MNTEEGCVLALFKEFVKLWGSGNQASFHLECKDGQAWFKLSAFLGLPGSPHFVPPCLQNENHGNHGHRDQSFSKLRRKKGPSQLLCDRTRAAAHRATLDMNKKISNDENTAAIAEVSFSCFI